MNPPSTWNRSQELVRPRGESLADLLERVLDKGIVVAGDIAVNLLDIELLTLKVRLLICSADTAQRMGIDWWVNDPFLNSRAAGMEQENRRLRQQLEDLQGRLAAPDEGSNGAG